MKRSMQTIAFYQKEKEEREKREKEEQDKKDEQQKKDTERQNASLNRQMASFDAIRNKTKENAEYERATTELRLQLFDQIGAGLGALSNLVGQQTAAGKTLALAEIAIGTATGFINGLDIAQKTAKGTGPAAAFAFPIFYATQVAAVLGAASRARAVLKAGGSNPTPPDINTKAPMAPTLSPTVQTNVQNAQAINQMSSQSTRAYVLNSDIQNEQQRNAYLQRNASI